MQGLHSEFKWTAKSLQNECLTLLGVGSGGGGGGGRRGWGAGGGRR